MNKELGLVSKLGMVPSGQNPISTNPRLDSEAIWKRKSLNVDDAGTLASFLYDGNGYGLMGFENTNPFYLVLAENNESFRIDDLDSVAGNVALHAGLDYRVRFTDVLSSNDLVGKKLLLNEDPTPAEFVELIDQIRNHDGITFNGYYDVNLFGLNELLYSKK